MEKIIEMLETNQAITAGETFVYNGERCEVPGMTDDQEEDNAHVLGRDGHR